MTVETIRELFAHGDWARDKLLGLADGLVDEQLDRPFDIGPGSLRATLRHLYGAERIWFERWQGAEQPQHPTSRSLTTIAELRQAWLKLAAARGDYLTQIGSVGLMKTADYTDLAGKPRSQHIGDLMLHVCNHGVHHRAQALNMLRRLGVKTPGLDYLFMRVERPTVEFDASTRAKLEEYGLRGGELAAAASLDLGTIRAWFAYCDWAAERVHAIAETLSDEQLDREFEIGLGRLRRTLLHIRDAERWWHDNWTLGPGADENKLPETTPMRELRALYVESAAQRNAYIERLSDEDLLRVVLADARSDLRLSFRLGESLLQLCGHGTHHRAQVLNMLRQLGAEAPGLDYVDYLHRAPDG